MKLVTGICLLVSLFGLSFGLRFNLKNGELEDKAYF